LSGKEEEYTSSTPFSGLESSSTTNNISAKRLSKRRKLTKREEEQDQRDIQLVNSISELALAVTYSLGSTTSISTPMIKEVVQAEIQGVNDRILHMEDKIKSRFN